MSERKVERLSGTLRAELGKRGTMLLMQDNCSSEDEIWLTAHEVKELAKLLNANSGDALELLRVTHNRLIDTLGDREYERSVQGQDAARLLATPPNRNR